MPGRGSGSLFRMLSQCTTDWRLKQQECIFSRFWRLTVLRSKCGRQGSLLLRPLSLACRQLSSPRVLTWSSLCVCLCPHLPFLQRLQSYWIRALPSDVILP